VGAEALDGENEASGPDALAESAPEALEQAAAEAVTEGVVPPEPVADAAGVGTGAPDGHETEAPSEPERPRRRWLARRGRRVK
jgi:hypothetical protein